MSSCQLSEDVCLCCEDSSKCSDMKQLKLYPGHSCSTVRILLKKVLFALCALNALTTAVCLVAAALRYLQLFAARRPCIDEPHPASEEVEEQAHVPDLDEFVPPIPPPSYFSTFYSYTPRVARRGVRRRSGAVATELAHITTHSLTAQHSTTQTLAPNTPDSQSTVSGMDDCG
ncbi:UNVERIFIED_CONTAM: hypothetical protein FKN15_072507 [Acipenser sinensis]